MGKKVSIDFEAAASAAAEVQCCELIRGCDLLTLLLVLFISVCGEKPGPLVSGDAQSLAQGRRFFVAHRVELVQLTFAILLLKKRRGASMQVWSLSSFKVSRQLLTNDLNHVSSVSLLMTASTALANKGLFLADLAPFVDTGRLIVIRVIYRGTRL